MATKKLSVISSGIGQLSLVEHALCPINSRQSLSRNQIFESGYFYTNAKRQRKRADVRVICPFGLSPTDEFYLWGLLALTLANKSEDGQFSATRHYMLRQLGVIDQETGRGGLQYQSFTNTLERLGSVTYRNSAFYDPIRSEHRKVQFSFFGFSMPEDETSSRAWRIVWNPIFYEFVKPIGGSLRFNFSLYRSLDPASRRLFLFTTKILTRRTTTPVLELRHLAIDILGYATTLADRDLKVKVKKAVRRLADGGILSSESTTFTKNRHGEQVVTMTRGERFFDLNNGSQLVESPLLEPLKRIGLDGKASQRLLAKFPTRLLTEWVDITLAAMERFDSGFFRKSPAAYLVDNLNHASEGTRTAPDWWHDVRKAEEMKRAELDRRAKQARDRLPEKAMKSVDDIQSTIFNHFLSSGQSPAIAQTNSKRLLSELKSRRRGRNSKT